MAFPFLHRASGASLVVAVALLAPIPMAIAHGPTDHEIADLTRRIASEPVGAAEFLRRGELYRLQHQWKLAQADYDRAARLDPASPAVEVCRAALYLDQGRAAQAQSTLDRLLARLPAHPEALRLRSQSLMSLGRPREAARDCDRLLEITATPSPDLYLARARAVRARGLESVDEALKGLDRGIERLGPLVSLELHAIELEFERKNFEGALARLDRVAPQYGRRETVLERRGQILAAAGRETEARQAFAEALAAMETISPSRRASPAMVEMEARLKAILAGGSITPDDIATRPR